MSELLTTTQAAARKNCDPSHIRRLILAGKLRAIKMGRDWVIAAEDLQEVTVADGPGRRRKS
jgi:excisionase family DNA binding protein